MARTPAIVRAESLDVISGESPAQDVRRNRHVLVETGCDHGARPLHLSLGNPRQVDEPLAEAIGHVPSAAVTVLVERELGVAGQDDARSDLGAERIHQIVV